MLRDHGADLVPHVVPRQPELFKFAGDGEHTFRFIGGDLAFSWPLDLTVWTVLGFFVARYAEQPQKYRLAIGAVLVAALVLGVATGLLVEPA